MRIVHSVVALAGWVLFAYWWMVVLRRVSRVEVESTLAFIVLTTIACVLFTALWSFHNARIARRKGPRTHVRQVAENWTHDGLGRSLAFKGTREQLVRDPVVLVRWEHEGKVYRPSSTLGGLPPDVHLAGPGGPRGTA